MAYDETYAAIADVKIHSILTGKVLYALFRPCGLIRKGGCNRRS